MGKWEKNGGIYNTKDLLDFSPTMKLTVLETSMYKHTV